MLGNKVCRQMLNHSQEQAFRPVPQMLNVLVEQAGKPVADIGTRWEFVVTRRLKSLLYKLSSTPSPQAR